VTNLQEKARRVVEDGLRDPWGGPIATDVLERTVEAVAAFARECAADALSQIEKCGRTYDCGSCLDFLPHPEPRVITREERG
jgi:hypothetical protein